MSAARPLKIGLVAPSIRGVSGEGGGIASHFSDLAAGLLALGHDVRAVVVADPGSLLPLPGDLAGLRVLTVPTSMPKWLHELTRWRWRLHTLAGLWHRSRRVASSLRSAHAAEAFDTIETTSSGLLILSYLSDRHRAPVATRVSTLSRQLVVHNRGKAMWNERAEDALEKSLVRRSDVILTHTLRHRDEICSAWGLDPKAIRIIPHGIALPVASELREARGRRLNLLFVGRCESRKGIDVLLDALPSVLERVPNADCDIIGHDPNQYWRRIWLGKAAPALSDRVKFRGPLSDAEVRAAYRDCDAFVAPSLYESFGLIYVEAMAWGKPVVGTLTGGVPEVVENGKTGLLVRPGNSEELAAALIGLLSDDGLRRSLGRAGRERVQARFSRSALASSSAALYEEMATGR